jgi:hypothetical protein
VPDNRRNALPSRQGGNAQSRGDGNRHETTGGAPQSGQTNTQGRRERNEVPRPEPRRDTTGSGGRDRESGPAAPQPGRDQRSERPSPGSGSVVQRGPAQQTPSGAPARAPSPPPAAAGQPSPPIGTTGAASPSPREGGGPRRDRD